MPIDSSNLQVFLAQGGQGIWRETFNTKPRVHLKPVNKIFMEFSKNNSRLVEEKPIGDKLIISVILCKIASNGLKIDKLQLCNCPIILRTKKSKG